VPHGEPHPTPKAVAEPHPAVTTTEPHPAAKPTPTTSEPTPATPAASHPQAKALEPHKPITEPEPVGGGHHVQTTPEGFELCSPPPCPNLRLMYKKQLAADGELRREMERLDAMRKIAVQQETQLGKTDPAFAKRINREAAELQKKLEAAKLGKPAPPSTPVPRTPIGPKPENPLPPLQTGPYKTGPDAVAGHHVHQSASMSPQGTVSAKGNPNHNPAIAIRQNVPGFTEAQHGAASATQRNLNRAMHGQPHEPNIGEVRIHSSGEGTLVIPSASYEDVKAYYALRAAGRSHEEALELVMRSRDQINASGALTVRVPSR
jgi:hypothetical protein